MRYALIRRMDISNGDGVGISLFVQGCHFHCKGCFNQETWDFEGGKAWTPEIEETFLSLAGEEYVSRISFLGGEPLAPENVSTVLHLALQLKKRWPEKKIWVFTGYTFESILKTPDPLAPKRQDIDRVALLGLIDVLADGSFVLEQQDVNHKTVKWVGSTNQRVIDVPKTLETGRLTLL